MRVLVVCSLYPPVVRGGYEMECEEVVRRLAERHEVLVLTSSFERRRAPSDPLVRRELDLVGSGPRGALSAPLSALRAVARMRGTLGSFKPDLAYVWNGARIPHAALSVLAESGTPVVFRVCEHWFGGLFAQDQFMRYLRPGHRGARGAWSLLARAVNRAPSLRLDPERAMDAAISWNSRALRRQTGVPAVVRPVLEGVIHPTTRRVDELAGLQRAPEDTPSVAFLGRLETLKGPDVAVRAIALMRRGHGIEARLTLAGPGERSDRRRLRELARSEGVEDLVEMPGALDRAAVERLLSGAHVLVVPSVWEEPFGMVAIEGAAASVPVVASDVGGISEGLHDGEHALLFPPGDAAACAAALVATLTDRQATAARVLRARERARSFALVDYLSAMERFLEDGARALGVGSSV